jgi:hypothetical protein
VARQRPRGSSDGEKGTQPPLAGYGTLARE